MRALVVLALVATPALAAKRETFATIWHVEPAPVPAAEQSVAPGALVLRQRLLPTGLAVLDEAWREGSTTIPAGTALIRATSATPVFCALAGKTGLLTALLSPLPDKTLRCFVDDDADGRFDRTVKANSNVATVPQPTGRLPDDRTPTIALRYSPRDPATFDGGYLVGVRYTGQAKIGTLRRFETVYGTEGHWGFFTGDNLFTKRDSDLPRAVSALGASFTVLGGDGKAVRVRVDQTIPAQPFAVAVTTMYY